MAMKQGQEEDTRMGTTYETRQGLGSRRGFVSALGVMVAALSLLNCGKKTETAAPAPEAAASGSAAAAPAAAKPFTVGFIYVGSKSDYGYNQAHAEAAKKIAASGFKVREEENVPETLDVQKTMESMINLDGATVLFPTSYGYFDPHILKMAEKYPNVTFLHCGGLYDASKHPKNVGSYFGYIGEAEYVAGIVAGMTTKTNKLGFIAAKPIPQVLRNINSYELGAKSVNPKVTMSVIFTGDWSLPVKEAEAANSLIDQGADVLTSHVDSPKVVIETAERRGVFSTGYHADQTALAPKGYLTGAEWNWEVVYKDYLDKIQKGQPWEHLVRGGFKEGFVKMSPYGAAVSEEAKKKAEEAKAALTAGTLVIFAGPLKDNTGKEVVAAGAKLAQRDITLESMGYLVDGVKGSVH
jgi:basic membrane protein A and related proteins